MFKKNLVITWRNLRKSKAYSIINITGLAVSLAACILLLLWVQDELSFDRFHKNADNIYHIASGFNSDGKETFWSNTPAPLATRAKQSVPEVAEACRIGGNWNLSQVEYNGKKFMESKNGLVDPSFFTMFNFPLIKGSALKPFPDNRSVILSETTAKKYFGNEDPIGKVLKGDDKRTYHVTGVMKDIPENSSIKWNILFPFDLKKEDYSGNDFWKSLDQDWGNYNYDTYIQIKPGANVNAAVAKLTAIHRKEQEGEFVKNLNYRSLPLTKMHLYTTEGKEDGILIVRVFTLIAGIILLIACINYVNLVTARANKRSKEISLRKIVGAAKSNLFWQFISESLVVVLISLLLATVMIYLVMPLYNDLSGKNIRFNPFNTNVLMVYGITLVATILLAGVYPALTLSSFKPLEAMKGKIAGIGKNVVFRKVLVTIQFSFSILLIIATIVIGKQLSYIREKNLGYDKENIIGIDLRNINDHYDAAKADLMRMPGIVDVTASGQDVFNVGSSTGDADWDGKTPQQSSFMIAQIPVERNFLQTLNMKLAEGSGFTGTPADSSNYILNETAIKEMGIKDPIGKRFTFHDKKGVIVGVVKDFHFKDMHKKIEPIIVFYSPGWRWRMYAKTTSKDASKALASLQTVWKQYNADYPFEYKFVDDSFNNMYKSDMRTGKLFNCFAAIAILISCLGLFGLITYTAESKVKEIGVRKVLGASVPGIVTLLSKDFLKLIVLSALIAFPTAWLALNKILEQYAYRTAISWWVFALAGIITFAIALMTISFQAIKAAMANPAKSLRSE